MEMSNAKAAVQDVRPMLEGRSVLFARPPEAGMTIGVVCDSEPSSLALLAAGVAGMAGRRALRERKRTK